jgi:predicted amidohydrolase
MRVTSIQLETKGRTKSETLSYVLGLLEKAPKSDLILLPEIWPTGYFSFSRYAQEAETIEGEVVETLRKKASQLGTHVFMGSFVEREGENLFNTSVMLGPKGEILAKYRKIHLFGYQSDERKLLKAGKDIAVISLPWGKTGFSTCYDLRFPELYRKMVDQGAEFFLVTSAWPERRLEAWTLFNRARAHENLAFLFSCNCAGVDNGATYAGHSMFINPLGQVVAEAGSAEEILSAEIDPAMVQQVRKDFTALKDRVLVGC